jgi:predicted CXXCH cytochrome family protein
MVPSALLAVVACALLGAAIFGVPAPHRLLAAKPPEPSDPKRLDPAAWGSDHVGQEIPFYMEGGECLFCHRNDVGGTWQKNRHNLTIREPGAGEPALEALRQKDSTKALADDGQLILGDTRAIRFLKRSQAYGKADMLSPVATFGLGRRARLTNVEAPHWDSKTFARQCAGCHATAVNPQTHAFSTVSLDCYACHGDASDEHANDPTLMPLAKAREDSPAVVTSICASCHIRNGKSKSSGLPYPNNFVAGDNLFQDFQVDFDQADDERLNPADRHVLTNVRDVVVHGRETTTCLSCHDVHTSSSKKHRELAVEAICLQCHDPGQPITGHKRYDVHSKRCRY